MRYRSRRRGRVAGVEHEPLILARVVSAQHLDDDREIVTIGFSELDEAEAEAQLQRVGPQEQRRHDGIDAVVEPDMTRRLYQVAEDDFTEAPARK